MKNLKIKKLYYYFPAKFNMKEILYIKRNSLNHTRKIAIITDIINENNIIINARDTNFYYV